MLWRWLVPVGVLAALLAASLSACDSGSSEPPSSLTVDSSSNGKQVKIAAGGTVQVVLESNPGTGFSWELIKISDTSVLETVDRPSTTSMVTPGEGAAPVVGAGVKETWKFRAHDKGAATISMEYSQPWAGGQKAAQKFDLTIVAE